MQRCTTFGNCRVNLTNYELHYPQLLTQRRSAHEFADFE